MYTYTYWYATRMTIVVYACATIPDTIVVAVVANED